MQYSNLNQENLEEGSGDHRPPDWPQRGEVDLSNVSFCYSPDTPLVLRSLTCHIQPGEKVHHKYIATRKNEHARHVVYICVRACVYRHV